MYRFLCLHDCLCAVRSLFPSGQRRCTGCDGQVVSEIGKPEIETTKGYLQELMTIMERVHGNERKHFSRALLCYCYRWYLGYLKLISLQNISLSIVFIVLKPSAPCLNSIPRDVILACFRNTNVGFFNYRARILSLSTGRWITQAAYEIELWGVGYNNSPRTSKRQLPPID